MNFGFPAGGGWLAAAMYSDFVPDETGVIARREEFSRRFYSSDDYAERKAIQLESNAAEHASNPALANFARVMELSGISVPHPEANYHVAGEKTVFFEVLGVDVRKAFSAAAAFSPGSGGIDCAPLDDLRGHVQPLQPHESEQRIYPRPELRPSSGSRTYQG